MVPQPNPKVERLRGNTVAFNEVVRKVQLALYAQGDYVGPIDGRLGPKTKEAIAHFEARRGLPVTGTLSDRLLDALSLS
ncbi:peptidoglycan-binding domain-containing protein [Pararhodospirillum photometricum]|uniref:Peptidoglycan binding-like domain-containing protein n=1 Tax=Pararhodospirillum photometricum DSM 122 TaxID=1150469 RepID=H6SN08_PARPM|nr:peptidoglycan-binding domain-containing protein [Pararhodospirillum photometricum]CCG06884.1 unnamed protein product [Pararhodospirillum photometricum DSM 122]